MGNLKRYALVTGATTGIGRDIAIYLDDLGYNIIAVARNEIKLKELRNILKNDTLIFSFDLSKQENIYKLYYLTSNYNIYIIVNNAGVGCYGEFINTKFEEEKNMIDLNVVAPHLFMKLFLNKMLKNNDGYILNVISSSVFSPTGPFMSSYYATKSYMYTLTNSVIEELKPLKSNVKMSCLCPGPVNTEFNKRLNIKFGVKALNSKYVAKYAIDKMFKNKKIIIPGINNKLVRFFSKILPNCILNKINYNIQKNKKCEII